MERIKLDELHKMFPLWCTPTFTSQHLLHTYFLSLESSHEDLSMIELVRPPSQQFREDIVKSPSMQSVAESIVSVIERQPGSRTSSRPGSRPESALGMRPVFPKQVSSLKKHFD